MFDPAIRILIYLGFIQVFFEKYPTRPTNLCLYSCSYLDKSEIRAYSPSPLPPYPDLFTNATERKNPHGDNFSGGWSDNRAGRTRGTIHYEKENFFMSHDIFCVRGLSTQVPEILDTMETIPLTS
jgi:hypothetical protein